MTTPAPFPNRRHWLLLVAALGVLFVGFLGTRGLNEPDEGRYAIIAQEMAKPGGDWWEPRMSGYGHYDKPPLIYWATAASFRLFGHNEWAARLPSLLGACGALFGLGWTAYRLRGAVVAWWATLICGTSVQFWAFGRILSPDMLLTGWCTLAVAAWAEAREQMARAAVPPSFEPSNARTTWGWWLVSLLCWSLAWWTKATPALIPLAGLLLGVLLTRDAAGRRALKPLLLLPAILLLGSAWYLSMMHTYPELKNFFFGRELAGRLAGRVDGRHGKLFYYVPVSLVASLPWWPLAAWVLWRQRRTVFPVASQRAFVWLQRPGVEGWIVLMGLLILSSVSSKLPSYTLTLAPWAALLLARVIVKVGGEAAHTHRTPLLWPAYGFAGVALVGAAVLPFTESRLGVNSSVREVSRFLRAEGAVRVEADRYWPGLEFYLPADRVRYVVAVDEPTVAAPPPSIPILAKQRPSRRDRIERYHERASDPGTPPNRFVEPNAWSAALDQPHTALSPAAGWWFVRYHPWKQPFFDESLRQGPPELRPIKVKRIGVFDLYRLPPVGDP